MKPFWHFLPSPAHRCSLNSINSSVPSRSFVLCNSEVAEDPRKAPFHSEIKDDSAALHTLSRQLLNQTQQTPVSDRSHAFLIRAAFKSSCYILRMREEPFDASDNTAAVPAVSQPRVTSCSSTRCKVIIITFRRGKKGTLTLLLCIPSTRFISAQGHSRKSDKRSAAGAAAGGKW